MNAMIKTSASNKEADLSSIPVAPWQVYQLGLEVNRLTEKMHHLLTANYFGESNRNDKWLSYNRKEAELIKQKCTYFHNCELYYYYLSGGLMAVNYEEPLNSSALESNLHWFSFKLNRNVEICEAIKKDGTKLRSQEIYKFITTIRNDIGNFYKSAAALYPRASINKAFITLNKMTVQTNCKMFNSLQLIRQQDPIKLQNEGVTNFIETCLRNMKTRGATAKVKII
ncbi:MAG: hypothetical protein ABFD04_14560 [Syntrophomonas sp.]